MSLRTRLLLFLPPLLLVLWFSSQSAIRWWVDQKIQGNVGEALPEFVLADATGRPWSKQVLAGKRALLHFFRSKCHSCDQEAEAMRALEKALPADVVMLHVMTDAVLEFEPALTAATLAQKNFQRPVLMADAKFVDAFHSVAWSNVTPITYVVDAQGVVRYGLRGAQTQAAVEQALAAVR
jgi:peroxiredoxin